MKTTITLLIVTLFSLGSQAQNPIGAWESFSTSESGDKLKNVVIIADGYQVMTTYNATTGKFISTNGGSWQLDGDMVTGKAEFDTANPELVGKEIKFKVKISDNNIEIVNSGMKFQRIDSGTPGKLQGAWLMSGRIRDGKTELRNTSGPRKTMKILSGTRFQWIAYNTETKQFMGTGGGTYTTINGEYTENIEFFSRDDSKAGLSLKFNYELIDGNWHHSGLSSKGDPIHEIWSLRE
ncbi:membrane or secreted protein [Mariniflexile gromovii]|uniref:Membrane or secreted protein n=1 Tax=Mariniflexile gromovii TaxID=362523 RepID=A0ABS4BYR5_9FLAO|nr:membrane or secreted protein [Mariniflexile gromovii]MBP0905718.1 membrane or secreted protein [Mariniflexile gromovii]